MSGKNNIELFPKNNESQYLDTGFNSDGLIPNEDADASEVNGAINGPSTIAVGLADSLAGLDDSSGELDYGMSRANAKSWFDTNLPNIQPKKINGVDVSTIVNSNGEALNLANYKFKLYQGPSDGKPGDILQYVLGDSDWFTKYTIVLKIYVPTTITFNTTYSTPIASDYDYRIFKLEVFPEIEQYTFGSGIAIPYNKFKIQSTNTLIEKNPYASSDTSFAVVSLKNRIELTNESIETVITGADHFQKFILTYKSYSEWNKYSNSYYEGITNIDNIGTIDMTDTWQSGYNSATRIYRVQIVSILKEQFKS